MTMALFDEKGRFLMLGIVVGAAAAMVGRELFMPIRRLGRPLAKEAVKSGLDAIEHGRERVGLITEHVADLLAEAAAERQQSAARTRK
jgi:hypothetical protein